MIYLVNKAMYDSIIPAYVDRPMIGEPVEVVKIDFTKERVHIVGADNRLYTVNLEGFKVAEAVNQTLAREITKDARDTIIRKRNNIALLKKEFGYLATGNSNPEEDEED